MTGHKTGTREKWLAGVLRNARVTSTSSVVLVLTVCSAQKRNADAE
jgi:hypothetical protein